MSFSGITGGFGGNLGGGVVSSDNNTGFGGAGWLANSGGTFSGGTVSGGTVTSSTPIPVSTFSEPISTFSEPTFSVKDAGLSRSFDDSGIFGSSSGSFFDGGLDATTSPVSSLFFNDSSPGGAFGFPSVGPLGEGGGGGFGGRIRSFFDRGITNGPAEEGGIPWFFILLVAGAAFLAWWWVKKHGLPRLKVHPGTPR